MRRRVILPRPGHSPARPLAPSRPAVSSARPAHPYLSTDQFAADRARIIAVLDAARDTRVYEAPEINEAVRQCARRARDGDLPPEALIVALKTLVQEVALPDMGHWYRDVIRNRLVVSAIEAYFAAAPQPD